MQRLLDLKDKELSLSKKESQGLKEDNERIHRMYMLMQKEAFPDSASKVPPANSVQLKNHNMSGKQTEDSQPIYLKHGG